MSDYVRKIVYLSKAAKNTLFENGSVTVGSVTITYDENDIYVTPTSEADIAAMLEGIFTVPVTGTSPVIVGESNTCYTCGEVSTLNFTPASTGLCAVRFTSGSTATVLTLPNTVKLPEWFDASGLDANTIYEINISDGVYGAVMSWPLN